MRITRLTMWAVELPLAQPYSLSGGRLPVDRLDSTIVRVDTDEGVSGWGESCPWGSTYLPAFAGGVRAGIAELAPAVLGLDPRRTDVVYQAMNIALPGHAYAKSPIDMACWDVAARAAGLPLCDMLGGRARDRVRLHSSIPSGTPSELLASIDLAREAGYTLHSAKIGGDTGADIERMRFLSSAMSAGEDVTFDCNRSWTPAQAIAALGATRELRHVIEQPCETLEQTLQVRRAVTQPLAVDESLHTLGDLLRIVNYGCCEVVGVKLARVGGITVARRMRDVCLEAGIVMNIEDTGGTCLAATAAVHLAQTVPEGFHRGTWLGFDMLRDDPSGVGVTNDSGWARAPQSAGIGVQPDPRALGEPAARFG